MQAQRRYLSQLAQAALHDQKNFVQVPVEPQPKYSFKSIRMLKGLAAFWLNSSCCEIRSCPWGRPGSIFTVNKMELKILHIEVKLLQESASLVMQRKMSSNKTVRQEPFALFWDSLFAKTDYAWERNPLVWLIHFEKSLEPMALSAKSLEEHFRPLVLAA